MKKRTKTAVFNYIPCHAELVSASHYLEIPKQVRNNRQTAFTLAEVLITLTIIGVIAALTIPNLMQSYKKHEVEVKVKEAYSILSNAIKMSEAEHGRISDLMPSDMSTVKTDWVDNYFKPYLKVSKDYGTTCLYKGRFIKRSNNGTSFGAGNYDSCVFRHILLDNGFLVSVGQPSGYILGNGTIAMLNVDIDGANKGDSQYGKDMFAFSYNKDGNVYGAIIEGHMDSFTIPSRVRSYCLTGGFTCAQYIMQNGWKIPDDYPIKKF